MTYDEMMNGQVLDDASDRLREQIAKECPILYEGEPSAYWECGSGWDIPLAFLSRQLEALNREIGVKHGLRIVAAQVKEKYATLRFYWSILIDGDLTEEQYDVRDQLEPHVEALVNEATEACSRVCEVCGMAIGTPGSPQCWTLGWNRYLCRPCAMHPLSSGMQECYVMNGRFYMGDCEIPNPFETAD